MKLNHLIYTVFALVLLAGNAFGQVKIGHANVELVLAYLPETKTMQQQIQTYEAKLAEKLKIKEDYARTKLVEYQEKAQLVQAGTATEADLKPLEEELTKLQQEIQVEQNDARQKSMAKRNELMGPITEKVGKAIKELADAEGLTYIINTTDGTGMSIVLHGPDENDMTEKLFAKLGIEIPKSE